MGEPPSSDQMSYRPIMVNSRVVGYLGLKPVLDKEDALSINFFSNQKRYLLFNLCFNIIVEFSCSTLMATYFKSQFSVY